MRRGWRAAGFAVVAQLILASAVVAASGWTLTIDPTTVKPDVAANVTLRATDTGGSSDTGCIYVVVPDAFVVNSAVVLDYSGPTVWAAKLKTSGAGTTVQIRNSDGNGKLKEGDWVLFRVNVTGTDPGTYTWTAYASQGNDCKDPTLASIGHSVRIAAATPTPTPKPTATPKPTTKPTATPKPDNTAKPENTAKPGSSARPTPSASPSATPAAIAPSPSASTPPGASPTPRVGSPTASSSAGALIAGGDDGGPVASPILNVPNLDGSAPVIELDGLLLTSSFSAFAWIVPGFLLGLPGLLVLLVVGAQAVAAAVFIPVTRRVLGRSYHGGRQLAR